MIFFSNATTKRLEGYARARGWDLAIVRTPDNSTGAYHATGEDGRPWSHWRGLGWSTHDARARIDEMLALRADEHRQDEKPRCGACGDKLAPDEGPGPCAWCLRCFATT